MSETIWDSGGLAVAFCAHRCDRCNKNMGRVLCVGIGTVYNAAFIYWCLPCFYELCDAIEAAQADSDGAPLRV